MKKWISVFLTAAMVFSMGISALADEEDRPLLIAPVAPPEDVELVIAPAPGGDEGSESGIAPAPAPEGPFYATFMGFDEPLVVETEDGTITKPAEEPTKEGCRFVGWSIYDDFVYVANFASAVIGEDTTFYPVFVESEKELNDYTVTVKDSEGNVLADTWVVLRGMHGTLGNTNTDANGTATFENLPDGIYNIQIMTSDRIYVGTYDVPRDNGRVYTMSKENVSILTISMGQYMNGMVIDGFEELMEEKKEVSQPILIACSMMQSWPNEDDATDAQKAIAALAGDKTLMHFDVEMEKIFSDSDDSEAITVTEKVMAMMIPFNPTTCRDISVYRYCDNKAEELIADETKPTEPQDGHCFVDSESGVICIYSSKFPTFAVGCVGTLDVEETYGEYNISVFTDEHGIISVDGDQNEGDQMIVTVMPDKGFTLETLNVTDADGNALELLAADARDVFTFTMPASDVTVEATFMEDNTLLNFCVDVHAEDYYYDSVIWAFRNEITTGVDDLHFDPVGEVTRAQMVTFLWRAADCPVVDYAMDFADVTSGKYYTEAVRWAVAEGITKGTGERQFDPDAIITRAEVVTFLWRLAKSPMIANMTANGPAPSPYTDVANDAYYYNAVMWAVMQKITTGTGENTFSPDDTCTRAEVVTFLWRYFEQ